MKRAPGLSMALIGGVLIAGLGLGSCSDNSITPPGLPGSAATGTQITRGRYLVTSVGACAECHNRGADNPNDPKWLAGYFQDPVTNPGDQGKFNIGPVTSHAANLTPDVATGLGGWTNQQVFNAIRTGKDKDGHTLCPPMPWPVFRNMTDEDLWSIVAYLRSIKPVTNAVPETVGPGGTSPANCDFFYAHLGPLAPYPGANEAASAAR